MNFDRIDLRILDLLQEDATIPLARIADRVGLSQTPCWKRIQKHEESGVIRRRVALLDPEPLGFGLTVFVGVEAAEHTAEWRAAFLDSVNRLDAVRDIYRLAGGYDYLLRVVVHDVAAFDAVYERLTAETRLRTVNAFFALETVKASTALPLAALQPPPD